MRAAWLAAIVAAALAVPAAAQGPGPGAGPGPGGGPMMQLGHGPGGGPGAMMGPRGTVSPGMMRERGPAADDDDDDAEAWRWRPVPLPLMFGPVDRALTLDEVKRIVDAHLAWLRNDRLRVGNVTEKDADTATVEIVTKEGGVLVSRIEVDRTLAGMRAVP
ncbi:MAG: hypothetical protein AB7F67_24665 [Rhodospirillaceae bacterium]